jgi:hypothetical protein
MARTRVVDQIEDDRHGRYLRLRPPRRKVTANRPHDSLLLTAPAERAPARARIDYSWCADASL